MKVLSNKKGLTLVEIVLAILILGMSATMLALTFSSAMRILNRATLYKNISTSAAASVELEDAGFEKNDDRENEQGPIGADTYDVSVARDTNDSITITYTKDGATKTTTSNGLFMYGTASKDDANVNLRYKEFLPQNYSYNVPATPIGD